MRPGRRRWLAAAAILLAGCSSSSSVPNELPSTLPAYYAQHLDWQPCDNGFQCARLLVPFDYARPGGPRFSLPVIRLPATDPAQRVGDLVVNPGGPGGSGVQYALGARGEFPSAVLARFDIVGFDPRGVAASEPALSCMTGPELDTYLSTDEMPDNAAQLATVVQQGKFYASRCEQNSRALLPYVGTQNAARDLDVLRAALGQSRLTYLGKSYGTYLGTWYAQLFPHRVRALVLDGAVDPDTTALQADITQAEGFQAAFGSFAAWCLAGSGCPLGQNAAAQLQALIVRANSRPLSQELGTGQVASGALLLNGVAAALYSKSTWPDLKDGLTNAFNGDGTVLVQLANLLLERNPDGTYANLVDANTAISCVDRPWPRSLTAWQAAASAAERAAPLFGPSIVWGNLPCAYWPVPAAPLPTIKAAGAPPILVVGTTRDPATPYRWAQALAADLSSGVLLGWNGDGHTAYGEGSACVDTIVNAYLISLKVPRSGIALPLIRAVTPSIPASGSSTTAGSWYRQENSNASELTSSTTAASVTSRQGRRSPVRRRSAPSHPRDAEDRVQRARRVTPAQLVGPQERGGGLDRHQVAAAAVRVRQPGEEGHRVPLRIGRVEVLELPARDGRDLRVIVPDRREQPDRVPGDRRGHPQRLLPEDGQREPVEELVPGEAGRDRHGVPGRARVVQQPVDAAQRQGLRR